MPRVRSEQERLEQQLEALQQRLKTAQERDEDVTPYKERLAAAQKDLKDFQSRQKAAEKTKD